MNLLPNTDKDILRKGLRQRFFLAASILLSCGVLIGVVLLLPSYILIRSHFNLISSLHAITPTEDAESLKAALKLPNEIDVKLKFFETTTESAGTVDLFAKMIGFLPPEVRLTSIALDYASGANRDTGLAIVISGTAADRDSLVAFGAALKESKLFTTVEVPVSSLTKNKDLPFSMDIFIEK